MSIIYINKVFFFFIDDQKGHKSKVIYSKISDALPLYNMAAASTISHSSPPEIDSNKSLITTTSISVPQRFDDINQSLQKSLLSTTFNATSESTSSSLSYTEVSDAEFHPSAANFNPTLHGLDLLAVAATSLSTASTPTALATATTTIATLPTTTTSTTTSNADTTDTTKTILSNIKPANNSIFNPVTSTTSTISSENIHDFDTTAISCSTTADAITSSSRIQQHAQSIMLKFNGSGDNVSASLSSYQMLPEDVPWGVSHPFVHKISVSGVKIPWSKAEISYLKSWWIERADNNMKM
jgi:hypothetical protein